MSMHCTDLKPASLLAAAFLSGCATPPPASDGSTLASAEHQGRIAHRELIADDIRADSNVRGSNQYVFGSHYTNNAHGSSTPTKLYRFTVVLPNGRPVFLQAWTKAIQVGACVIVVEREGRFELDEGRPCQ